MTTNPLIGRTIKAIFIAEDKLAVKFELTDGDPIIARVDADCCSYTWIEDLGDVSQILDSPVVSVENLSLREDKETDDGAIRFYGCRITTRKGFTTIDYRNSSNGYYGGSLEWPSPNGNFYGGVHGQNISKEQWQQVMA